MPTDPPDLPSALATAVRQGRVKAIDLTYPLDDKSPFWPEGSPASPYHAETSATYGVTTSAVVSVPAPLSRSPVSIMRRIS